MKITHTESLLAEKIAATAPTQPGTSQNQSVASTDASASPAAEVNLSAMAQTIAVATAAVKAAPDTRDDLVAKIKAQVDGGTYKVSNNDIADQMMRRAQADRLQ